MGKLEKSVVELHRQVIDLRIELMALQTVAAVTASRAGISAAAFSELLRDARETLSHEVWIQARLDQRPLTGEEPPTPPSNP
jgi:hypothetical protein